MRFFYDYTSADDAILDYKGQEFKSPAPAIDYGRTIADHLRHALNENWHGWTIAIRNIQGETVHQLIIGSLELEAA
jgi:hypothetical protein